MSEDSDRRAPVVFLVGAVARIVVSLMTVKLAAALPKFTPVAPVKFTPVMRTAVPPAVVPVVVPRPVTEGAGAVRKVNSSAAPVAEVPLLVVTRTSTRPAVWAGATAVIEPSELTVKLAAAVPPKLTAVAPEKLAPAMKTAGTIPMISPMRARDQKLVLPVFAAHAPATSAGTVPKM